MREIKLWGVKHDSNEAGIYGTIQQVHRGVTVTVLRVDEERNVYLITDEVVGSDAGAVSIINQHAAERGIPNDKIKIRRVSSRS